MNAEPSHAQTELRLFQIAGAFVFLYSAGLSLAPAVLARSWSVGATYLHWIVFPVWAAVYFLTYRHSRRRLGSFDPYLLPIVALFTGWGILTIWQLSEYLALRQLIWLVVGLGIFNLMLYLPADFGILRKYKYISLTAGLALTAVTLIFGTNPTGSGLPLWIGCCGIYLQPSEPLKLLLILFFAAYLADRKVLPVRLVPLLVPIFLLSGLALLLLVIQRDLGTAFIIMFTLAVMVFLATNNQKFLAACLIGFITLGALGYSLFDVVRLRFDAWLYPWADPAGRSYQIIQSMIAVASGGLFGRGPGMGVPELVPVAPSDFIFATIAEETGLIGGIGFLLILALLLNRGVQIALNAQNRFHRYLAGGLTTLIIAQSILIIGGNLRLNPLTGVTLPFVSYGGSSLVSSLVALACLAIISSSSSSGRIGYSRSVDRSETDQRSFSYVTGILGSGLAGCVLLLGWWGIVREPELSNRTDNFRLPISDFYSPRGNFFDRFGIPLTENQGEPGEITRIYLTSSLGNILGYSDFQFGQAGLENALDSYLRGRLATSEFDIWANYLLYGQHPTGRDIKLTLNSTLQAKAEALFAGHNGAAVALNAHTGEILMMSSFPNYDPNQLQANWETLITHPDSPLLNRAVQGRYPIGSSLGSILFAKAQIRPTFSQDTSEITPTLDISGTVLNCAISDYKPGWVGMIQAGCPGALAALGELVGYEEMLSEYDRLAVEDELEYLDTRSPADTPDIFQNSSSVLDAWMGAGISGHLISPLQAAIAVAPLSNKGVQPAPQLVLAVNVEDHGWTSVILPAPAQQVFSTIIANTTANNLKVQDAQIWQTVGLGYQLTNLAISQTVTWYTGGSLPYWQGEPIVVAVVLEEANPSLAEAIGQGLLLAILTPAP